MENEPARLGYLPDQCVGIFCWCNRCSHNAVLPVDALLPRLGPDIPVPMIARHLVCSSCGARDLSTRPAWRGLGEVANHGPSPVEPSDKKSRDTCIFPLDRSEGNP